MRWDILLIIIAIYIINLALTYKQTQNYYKTLNLIKNKNKDNLVSTGKEKKLFRFGTIVIISVNSTGTIEFAQKLSGISLFSRFKAWDEVIGLNIYDENLKEDYKIKNNALNQAISFIKNSNNNQG